MTKKLYWKYPYKTSFKAEIIEVKEKGLILDKTLFYPQGGGQVCDKGVIKKYNKEFNVKFVSKEGQNILHHLSGRFQDYLKQKDLIDGKIDWKYRYGVMCAHSSQHVLSALIKNEFDIDTSHANIFFEDVSLQIAQRITHDQFKHILLEFTKICTIENHHFYSKFIPLKEIKNQREMIRGKIPNEDVLRIIEVENCDLICCGGTHVQNSTEIGPIYVYEFRKGKDIKFMVGNKAINEYSRQNVDLIRMASSLNIPITKLPNKIEKQIDLISNLQEKNKILAIKTLELIARNPNMTLNQINVGVIETEMDYKIISKNFRNFPPNYLLIIKEKGNKFIVLSNSQNAKADDVVQSLLKKFGGKGGGNPSSAQVTLQNNPKDIISEIKLLLT